MEPDAPITPVANTAVTIHSKVPTSKEVYARAYAIYKENLKSILTIAGVSFVLSLVYYAALGPKPQDGWLVRFIQTSPDAVLYTCIGIVIVAAFTWISIWTQMAMQYVIAHHSEKVPVKNAFAITLPLFWQYIWVLLLTALAIMLPILVVAGIMAGMFFLDSGLSLAAGILGGVAIIAYLIIVGTWLSFSTWVFFTTGARGTHALRASREAVRGKFADVFGTIFIISLVLFILLAIFNAVVFGIAALFEGSAGSVISQVLSTAPNVFFVSPVLASVVFTIYVACTSLPTSQTPEVQEPVKKTGAFS